VAISEKGGTPSWGDVPPGNGELKASAYADAKGRRGRLKGKKMMRQSVGEKRVEKQGWSVRTCPMKKSRTSMR